MLRDYNKFMYFGVYIHTNEAYIYRIKFSIRQKVECCRYKVEF